MRSRRAEVVKALNQNKMAVESWIPYNLIVIITTSRLTSINEMRLEGTPSHPHPRRLRHQEGVKTPLITIFHLLNKIMLITYIALCKKEIYKD